MIFVISPDSIASRECGVELDQAIHHNKRLVPILHRDVNPNDSPPSIAQYNWIFFRESDDFDSAFQSLLKALSTDIEYVKAHTRLLQRAVEWDKKGRDRSFLLAGSNLKEAQQWFTASSNKEPKPTPLQSDYLINSGQSQIKRQGTTIGAIGVGLMVTTGLAFIALSLYQRASG